MKKVFFYLSLTLPVLPQSFACAADNFYTTSSSSSDEEFMSDEEFEQTYGAAPDDQSIDAQDLGPQHRARGQ